MSTTIYKIEGLCGGRFSIMPHPQGGEALEEEVLNFKRKQIEVVISMLTTEEQLELKLTREKQLCEEHGIIFLNYPIKDEVADSDQDTIEFIDEIEKHLTVQKQFLFHCRGGVGRSSMILSLVCARLGIDPQISFDLISISRGETAPESEFQKRWVQQILNVRNP